MTTTLYFTGSHGKLNGTIVAKPLMENSRGRRWVSKTIKIDGKNVEMHYDSMRGRRGYFEYKRSWYFVDLFELETETENDELTIERKSRNRK